MIIHNLINCKNYIEIIQRKSFITSLDCPRCHAKGRFHRHGFYNRTFCELIDGMIKETHLEVLRLQCISCHTTHALLPYKTIPYKHYNFDCQLHICEEKHLMGLGVYTIAKSLNISVQLVLLVISYLRLMILSLLMFLRSQDNNIPTDSDEKTILSTMRSRYSKDKLYYEYFRHSGYVMFVSQRRFKILDYLRVGMKIHSPT